MNKLFILLTFALTSSAAIAQNSPPPTPRIIQRRPVDMQNSAVLRQNYKLTLTLSDKDKPETELSLILATEDFSAKMGEPLFSISGHITIDNNEDVLLVYNLTREFPISVPQPLGQQSIVYGSSEFSSSVKLHLGEPQQILKSGTKTYTLKISQVPEKDSKD